MTAKSLYEPRYTYSWALVVGINKYLHASPLNFACNDAGEVAQILQNKFEFPADNIILITDESATRDRIMYEYLEFAGEKVSPDDRIVLFFAGHGYTRPGARGDVGYLVPVDGTTENLASLIRWDELTRNTDLIPAKHILFIMDACYGGLAITRALSPGSMRFAKDMLQRYSRQVLTAGKADEVVADSGGPRPGHSIFTGHFLNAIEGAANTMDGVLTANRVMAYVYDQVAKDHYSRQTPHYGFLDGDGDMIFDLSPIANLTKDSAKDEDILIEIPLSYQEPEPIAGPESLDNQVKELISEPRFRIKLRDLTDAKIRHVLSHLGGDAFPVQTNGVTPEEFSSRIKRYEETIRDLITIVVLLARWGGADHRSDLEQILARIPDIYGHNDGLLVWLGLRWYPVMLLQYAAGITALSANDYNSLSTLLLTPVGSRYSGRETQPIITAVVQGMLEVRRANMFKTLPGHERHYVPDSEYIFSNCSTRVKQRTGRRESPLNGLKLRESLTLPSVHHRAHCSKQVSAPFRAKAVGHLAENSA